MIDAYRRHFFSFKSVSGVCKRASARAFSNAHFCLPAISTNSTQATIKDWMDRGGGPMRIGFVFCRDYVKTYILRFPVLSLDYSAKKNVK